MSDFVRPQRQQPTRLPRPWDSPGKNTAVGCHFLLQCMKVKRESEVAQSGPTVSDPMACSPPGSSIHGICQARVLEWGAIAFSSLSPRATVLRFTCVALSAAQPFCLLSVFYGVDMCVCACVCVCVCVCVQLFSHVRLFVTSWIVTLQAPLSVGFPRQEYWSGHPFTSPGNLSDPRI